MNTKVRRVLEPLGRFVPAWLARRFSSEPKAPRLRMNARPRLAGWALLVATFALAWTSSQTNDLLVADSIAKTAANVLNHPEDIKILFAFNVLAVAMTAFVVVLFQELLRPVNGRLMRTAVILGFIGTAVQGSLSVFLYGTVRLLGGTPYRDAFRPLQFQAIAHLCLQIFYDGMYVSQIFLGLFGLVIGYLIFRSTFLPRALGVIVAIGGLGWTAFVDVNRIPDPVSPFAMAAGYLCPLVLSVWLIAKGVNVPRWRAMAAHTGTPVDPPEPPSRERVLAEALAFVSENLTGHARLARTPMRMSESRDE